MLCTTVALYGRGVSLLALVGNGDEPAIYPMAIYRYLSYAAIQQCLTLQTFSPRVAFLASCARSLSSRRPPSKRTVLPQTLFLLAPARQSAIERQVRISTCKRALAYTMVQPHGLRRKGRLPQVSCTYMHSTAAEQCSSAAAAAAEAATATAAVVRILVSTVVYRAR